VRAGRRGTHESSASPVPQLPSHCVAPHLCCASFTHFYHAIHNQRIRHPARLRTLAAVGAAPSPRLCRCHVGGGGCMGQVGWQSSSRVVRARGQQARACVPPLCLHTHTHTAHLRRSTARCTTRTGLRGRRPQSRCCCLQQPARNVAVCVKAIMCEGVGHLCRVCATHASSARH
jgi:hypothetical protein